MNRVRDKLNIMTAFLEQQFRVRRLEVVGADLAAGNVCRNREHGCAAAMAVVEAVDQMEIAGTTTSRAHRQLACQIGLGAGSKCGTFLMAHMNPVNGLKALQ